MVVECLPIYHLFWMPRSNFLYSGHSFNNTEIGDYSAVQTGDSTRWRKDILALLSKSYHTYANTYLDRQERTGLDGQFTWKDSVRLDYIVYGDIGLGNMALLPSQALLSMRSSKLLKTPHYDAYIFLLNLHLFARPIVCFKCGRSLFLYRIFLRPFGCSLPSSFRN